MPSPGLRAGVRPGSGGAGLRGPAAAFPLPACGEGRRPPPQRNGRPPVTPAPRRFPIGWLSPGASAPSPISAPPAHRAMGRSGLIGGGGRGKAGPARLRLSTGWRGRGGGVGCGGSERRRRRRGDERVPHGAAEEMAGPPRGHLQPATVQDGRLPGRHAADRPGERDGMRFGSILRCTGGGCGGVGTGRRRKGGGGLSSPCGVAMG